jgi:hypothetical protein
MRDQKDNFGSIKKQIIAEILDGFKQSKNPELKDHIKAINLIDNRDKLFAHLTSSKNLSFIKLEKYQQASTPEKIRSDLPQVSDSSKFVRVVPLPPNSSSEDPLLYHIMLENFKNQITQKIEEARQKAAQEEAIEKARIKAQEEAIEKARIKAEKTALQEKIEAKKKAIQQQKISRKEEFKRLLLEKRKAQDEEKRKIQDEAIEKARIEAENKRLEDEKLAKDKADKKLRKTHEKELKREKFLQQKELELQQQKELAEQLKKDEEQRQQELKDAGVVKDKIIKKTIKNFQKFQPFFDFLRKKRYLDVEEIGFFGSGVYKELLTEVSPSRDFSDFPKSDFDFYCIPTSQDSQGIFRICADEVGARINFLSLLEEFNKTNPNMQISLLTETDNKKSVNYGKGDKKSLNFKLIATFIDDKQAQETFEFDLNFYNQLSVSQKLQWQINTERAILSQDCDGNFSLKLNHSDCEKTQNIEEFIVMAQKKSGSENFLTTINPVADKFIDRIVNKKGAYKYFSDDELNQIKSELVNNYSEKLITELSFYTDYLQLKIADNDESKKAKKSEYEKIIKAVENDPILSQLITEKTPALSVRVVKSEEVKEFKKPTTTDHIALR